MFIQGAATLKTSSRTMISIVSMGENEYVVLPPLPEYESVTTIGSGLISVPFLLICLRYMVCTPLDICKTLQAEVWTKV